MTSIKKFGGEFALIDVMAKIIGRPKDKSVVVGIGDDTAVVEFDKKHYLLFTVDMLVESDHFRKEWSTPEQIGMKAMEINVSDIAAMGGLPKYALVSISLPEDTPVEFIKKIYGGMSKIARKYKFDIIGGNTTHGRSLVIDVIVIGLVDKDKVCRRSDARVGDLICVTGDLGKSTAGLETLKAGLKGDVKEHLEPKCRLKEAQEIAKYANAMIDVSDGLASEVNHICEMSKVGAEVFKGKIPMSKNTLKLAKNLKKDAYSFALHGGEDFELVFTIPKQKLEKIKIRCPVTVVGRIVDKRYGANLVNKGEKIPLKGGYDHFKIDKR
ncbi:MAG: thiamine-phosphate kinase [Candidatus Altiarchaeota archaeon]